MPNGCDSSNTVTVNILRDNNGNYTVCPDGVINVPSKGCLTIALYGVSNSGCEFNFNPSYPHGGSKFQRGATQTDGPFSQDQTYTYTAGDPSVPADAAKLRVMGSPTPQHTIQVGSSAPG